MTFVPDAALARLRRAADEPDLAGTPYEVDERIGRGGMGVVFRARDRRLERDVAIKVLDLGDPAGTENERLRREARILAGLEHPGIVPVHDVGTLPDGRSFYVMKLVHGDRLDRCVTRLGSLGERLRLFVRFCEPVAFAHERGVVHRDLKPENLMVGPFGEALVMDWGVARVGHDSESALGHGGEAGGTQAGSVIGTPGYMSPEQERGDSAAVDERSDVFALGAVLRFVLAGAGAGADAVSPPPAVRSIVARACAAEPPDRYASVRALAADVERFLDGRPVSAHRETVLERLGRWFRRYQTAVVLVLAYLILRMLLLLFLR